MPCSPESSARSNTASHSTQNPGLQYSMLRFAVVACLLSSLASAQSHKSFEKRFKAIMSRPEYRHSRFGVEFYSLDQSKVLYAWNPQELFIPGSTTKILTVGTALELLGPDF